MELTHENNTAQATEPSAIVTAKPVSKLPISNNDPTRDVSQPKRWVGAATIAIAAVALVLLALAAVLLVRT